MTAPAWQHGELMTFVPYEIPDMFGGSEHKIGVGVMPRNAAGMAVPALAEMVAPFGAINPQARRLIFAAPMMYQTIASTAAFMRKLIDEIDVLVQRGHVKEEVMHDLVRAYEAIERESLTVMQVATEGLGVVATGLRAEAKGRKP